MVARQRAIETIKATMPLESDVDGAVSWLKRKAGWSEVDIAYYNVACAMPSNESVEEWATLRPGSFETFQRLWDEAEQAGVTVYAILVREEGLDRWRRSLRGRGDHVGVRGEILLDQVLREMLREKMQAVGDCLETEQWGLAREILEGKRDYRTPTEAERMGRER